MNRLPFVLWLSLWPLVSSIVNYLHIVTLDPVAPPHWEAGHVMAAFFDLVLWIWIANLLWKDGSKQ